MNLVFSIANLATRLFFGDGQVDPELAHQIAQEVQQLKSKN